MLLLPFSLLLLVLFFRNRGWEREGEGGGFTGVGGKQRFVGYGIERENNVDGEGEIT